MRRRGGAEEDGVSGVGASGFREEKEDEVRAFPRVRRTHYPAQKGTIRSLLLIPPPAPSKVERQEREARILDFGFWIMDGRVLAMPQETIRKSHQGPSARSIMPHAGTSAALKGRNPITSRAG